MHYILLSTPHNSNRFYIAANLLLSRNDLLSFMNFVCAWGGKDTKFEYNNIEYFGYEVSNDLVESVKNILEEKQFTNITEKYLKASI
jgi:hypothetical protein